MSATSRKNVFWGTCLRPLSRLFTKINVYWFIQSLHSVIKIKIKTVSIAQYRVDITRSSDVDEQYFMITYCKL